MIPLAEDILTDESYTMITGLINALPQKLGVLHDDKKLETKELLVLNQAVAFLKLQVENQMSFKQRSLIAKARKKKLKKSPVELCNQYPDG